MLSDKDLHLLLLGRSLVFMYAMDQGLPGQSLRTLSNEHNVLTLRVWMEGEGGRGGRAGMG